MATLRALFFDIDDTLYSTSQFASLARDRAVAAMVEQGLQMPARIVRRELEEVIAEFTSNYPAHFDKLLSRLPREAWARTNRAVLIAAGVMAYHATKAELRPFPDVIPVLRALNAQTDLVLGVITHGLEVKQAEKLLLLKIVPYLHPAAIFISDQVGISKPNPKLYQRACHAFGLDPREVMYVGDHVAHDIDPTNALGMVSVLIEREGCRVRPGQTEPRYRVTSLLELVPILAKDFELAVDVRDAPATP